MLYRKKPVVIEAEQVQAGMIGDLISSAIAEGKARTTEHEEILIETLEGSMIARPGDWIIKGVKGEFYPCKPDIFAKTYDEDRTDGLTFARALEALKDGHRVARSGWNGKGMWIAISGHNGPREIAFENFWSKHASEYARLNGGSAAVLPCIIMKTATGEILMGWLASQTDMLADDWMVLPEDEA